jgi:iron complex outermembrane receptor protein
MKKEGGMKKAGRMKKGGVFLIGLCFFIFICFGAVWAEEVTKSEEAAKSEEVVKSEGQKDYQVFDLGEIFVTSEKPPAVQETVIMDEVTAEDIKATSSRTVAEALAYVPGIRVSTGRKNEPSIQIHGLDQTRILVLIDGVPYYETKYGKLDLNEIPVDNVAKIEVTKGAASVLYGPNALMGVVNIITKKPIEKPSAEAILEIGPNETNRVSVSHGMKVGIFNYWLNYGHQESNGWRLSDGFETKEATIMNRPGTTTKGILEDGGYRINSDYKTNSFWAKVGIDPNPGSEYYLNFHYIARDKGDPPSIYGGTTFTSRPAFSTVFDRITKYDDWGIDLSGQQKVFEPLTFKGKLFYHNHTDEYTSYSDQFYGKAIALSTYKDYNLGGSLFADVQPIEWNILRLAFNYRVDSHNQRDDIYLPYEESYARTGSIGLENEFNWVKNLSLVVGASFDWFHVTKAKTNVTDKAGNFLRQQDSMKPGKRVEMDNFDPMIGATYNLTDTTRLFGSIARKVRFPTLNELFSSKGGNVELKAEKAINYTLGVSQLFSKYAKVEFSGFYHDLSDFISRNSSPITNPLAQNQNFAKIEMLGFELNGEVYPIEDLVLNVGYTFNDANDRSPGRVTDHVLNVPAHKIDMGVHYTIPYIKIPSINSTTHLDLQGIYLSNIFSQLPTAPYPNQETQKVRDYYIVNARISTSFLKYFEAYLALANIFDKNYESEYGFPAPGRSFFVGVSAKY